MRLRVSELQCGYENTPLFESLSFALDVGKTVKVCGSNGVGKSTFLKCLNGRLSPLSGQVLFEGADVSPLSPQKRWCLGISSVGQAERVFRNLSVRENLSAVQAKRPLRASSAQLALLDNTIELPMDAGKLSWGQAFALSFVAALSAKPKLLILDEPFAGLSSYVRTQIIEILTSEVNDGLSLIVIEQISRIDNLEFDQTIELVGARK